MRKVALGAAVVLAAVVLGSALTGRSGDGGDEFATTIHVVARLSKPPAVGETATMTFTVLADRAYDSATFIIELPSNIGFVEAPPGMDVSKTSGAHPAGPALQAIQRRPLPADQRLLFEAKIEAFRTGPAEIRVRVVAPTSYGADAGADEVFVTVGLTPATSKFGIDVPATSSVTPRTGTGSA